MGTKGPKAGNIFTSLRSRGLVGGQGQDPSIKGMGSPLKQTKDGSDASMFGSITRAFKRKAKISGTLGGNYPPAPPSEGFGHGNRHMDGPPPKTEQSENSKAVLESEKKGDEAINDKMKATPLKQASPSPSPKSKKPVSEKGVPDEYKGGPKKKNHKY